VTKQEFDTNPQPSTLEEFYVTRVNWLVSQGREDLIDPIADEFERHLDIPGASRTADITDIAVRRRARDVARKAS
jgi:hypothetical protein